MIWFFNRTMLHAIKHIQSENFWLGKTTLGTFILDYLLELQGAKFSLGLVKLFEAFSGLNFDVLLSGISLNHEHSGTKPYN